MDFIQDEKRREWYEGNLAERYKQRRWIGKSYYDKPDGEDLPGKVWFATKFGSAAGILTGIANTYNPTANANSTRERMIKFSRSFLPVVVASNLYVAATYASTNLRKQDDIVNHIIGGLAAGTVFGAALKNYKQGFWLMMTLGFFGGMQKYYYINNLPIVVKKKNKYYSSYFLRKFDTTLYKDDIKGNWTKEPKS